MGGSVYTGVVPIAREYSFRVFVCMLRWLFREYRFKALAKVFITLSITLSFNPYWEGFWHDNAGVNLRTAETADLNTFSHY